LHLCDFAFRQRLCGFSSTFLRYTASRFRITDVGTDIVKVSNSDDVYSDGTVSFKVTLLETQNRLSLLPAAPAKKLVKGRIEEKDRKKQR
jgi:hypothetical protein